MSSDDDNENNRKVIDIGSFRKQKEEERKHEAKHSVRINLSDVSNSNGPLINLPPFTKLIVSFILLIQLAFVFLPENYYQEAMYYFGFVPASYLDGSRPLWSLIVSPFTYMFLHGGWFHVVMNSVMLVAFGAGVEKAIGARNTFFALVFCGLLGILIQFLFSMSSDAVVIGISGAISGLFSIALMTLKQQHNNMSLLPIFFVWIGVSVLFGIMGSPDGGNVAWIVHIGGFVSGFIYYYLLVRFGGKNGDFQHYNSRR